MNTGILIDGAEMEIASDIPLIYQWGIDVIKLVQKPDNPVIEGFMRGVSIFGAETGCLILLPLVFWCIDEKKGIRFGIMIMLSTWISLFFKLLLHQPRPFQLDPSVGKSFEATYGIPSGHAQNSLVLWTLMASWTKKKRFYAAAILISLVTGISRLYLGVHFPTDLFAGWFLGILVLICYFLFGERIGSLLARGGLRAQLIAVSALAFVITGTCPGNAILGGAVLGMGAGYALMLKYVRFTAKLENRKGKALILLSRYLIGVTGLVVLAGLRHFMPDKDSAYYRLACFFLLILLELWVYTAAPWIFVKLRLADTGV
jgi:membrane-associated phospholipid phosphatase